MTTAYYNEIDPHAAGWLRNLAEAGHIAPGDVDERSIRDVPADAVRSHGRCHFFAGVGGWDLALRLAGWPADRLVWTGSCPCQPFSAAGKGLGEADDRHLWPDFRDLISKCRPPTILGEQVASKAGREWLARVRSDLEELGYAVGAADLCAAGVASPHIRQRLFWVADSRQLASREHQGPGEDPRSHPGQGRSEETRQFGRYRHAFGLAVPSLDRRDEQCGDTGGEIRERGPGWSQSPHCGIDGGLANDEVHGRRQRHAIAGRGDEGVRSEGDRGGPANGRDHGGLGHSDFSRPQGCGTGLRGESRNGQGGQSPDQAGDWGDFDVIPCLDSKYRRVESGTFPLAHGIPSRKSDPRLGRLVALLARLGHSPKSARRVIANAKRNRGLRLRGYGNAIVPQIAAEFIGAFLDAERAGLGVAA